MIIDKKFFIGNIDYFQETFKRLVEAVPEIKFELYSFKSTIKGKERMEQESWFGSKVKQFRNVIDIWSFCHQNQIFHNYKLYDFCSE